jgi:hypothetical protein
MRVAAHALPALAMGATVLVAGSAAARACDADVHYTYNQPVEIEGVLKSGTGHHEAPAARRASRSCPTVSASRSRARSLAPTPCGTSRRC